MQKRKLNCKTVVGIIVSVTLIGSIIYVLANIFLAENDLERSNYTLMLLQCLLGVVVMMLPGILERCFSFDIPDYMEVMYFIFLYCAIYLGEVRSFYYLIPNWDTILHAFSGAMLGAFGYSVVSIFNNSNKVKVELNPVFVALFAFCFAVSVGALWEIYEYIGDGLFGLNMQKFRDALGNILVGRDALGDTMDDIIVDACSAAAMVIVGYVVNKVRIIRAKKAEGSAKELADPPCADN